MSADPRGEIWLDTDMFWVIANYEKLGPTKCAEHLGNRTPLAVRVFAHRLGLHFDRASRKTEKAA